MTTSPHTFLSVRKTSKSFDHTRISTFSTKSFENKLIQWTSKEVILSKHTVSYKTATCKSLEAEDLETLCQKAWTRDKGAGTLRPLDGLILLQHFY